MTAETATASAAVCNGLRPRIPRSAAIAAEYRRSDSDLFCAMVDRMVGGLGFGEVRVKWAVLSVPSPLPREWMGLGGIQKCSMAVRFDHDAAAFSRMKGAMSAGTAEGLPAWKVPRTLGDPLYAASLDGRLALAAPDAASLAALIRLYRSGEGEGMKPPRKSPAPMLRVAIPDAIREFRAAFPGFNGFLDDLDTLCPEGAAALRSMKNFVCSVEFGGEGGMSVSISARTASNGDAENLSAMLQDGVERISRDMADADENAGGLLAQIGRHGLKDARIAIDGENVFVELALPRRIAQLSFKALSAGKQAEEP